MKRPVEFDTFSEYQQMFDLMDRPIPVPTNKPLIIGEQPSKTGDPDTPIQGRIGRRLAEFAGLSWDEYLTMFDRVNLLHIRAEYSGKSEAWNDVVAKQQAHRIALGLQKNQIVLLLGIRAAKAFDLKRDYFQEQHVSGAKVYVLPHPSGLNRWYNDPQNSIAISVFLTAIVREIRRWVQ